MVTTAAPSSSAAAAAAAGGSSGSLSAGKGGEIRSRRFREEVWRVGREWKG